MSQNREKGLVSRFASAVGRGIGWLLDKSFTMGPPVWQESPWKAPALRYNDTPTKDLIAGLDRAKVIHLHEYYKIADALSWDIGMYFISRRDTATFLMPFSEKLACKADEGRIESWLRRDFMEQRRDIHYIRVGDLLDHLAENPLPGDDWHVRTQGRGALFAGDLRYRPLQIRKLMVLSAVLAPDEREAIAAAPDRYIRQPRGSAGAAPKPL